MMYANKCVYIHEASHTYLFIHVWYVCVHIHVQYDNENDALVCTGHSCTAVLCVPKVHTYINIPSKV